MGKIFYLIDSDHDMVVGSWRTDVNITEIVMLISWDFHSQIQSANQMVAAICIKSCRCSKGASGNVYIEHQNGEKFICEKWCWPWHGCWCQKDWFEYFKNLNANILVFLHITVYTKWFKNHPVNSSSTGRKCLVDEKDRRRIVWADRKATVITKTLYNRAFTPTNTLQMTVD